MIIKTIDLKENCSKILGAVDNGISPITETLELIAENGILSLNVTNRSYYVSVKFPLEDTTEFRATVNANLFLKLMAQFTTEYITLETVIDENQQYLAVTGNGLYKLPLVFDGDHLLELPKIYIKNPTVSFDMNTDILTSILVFNSKEVQKNNFAKPIQQYYYIDDQGCITFTAGACVNSFTLPVPVKFLLNNKIVKLFKLFKSDSVTFTLGQDPLSEDIVQTKVMFDDGTVSLTAIIPSEANLINSVPVTGIRGRANKIYSYSVVLNRVELLGTLNRLLLLTGSQNTVKSISKFEFGTDSVVIYDKYNAGHESIKYINENTGIEDTYSATLDINDLKLTLEGYKEEFVTLGFGDHQAFVIKRNNIISVVPESKLV